MPPKFELKPQGISSASLRADITMRKAVEEDAGTEQVMPVIPKGTFWWRTPAANTFTELREVHHGLEQSWIADSSPMVAATGMYFLKLLEQDGDYSNEEIPTWPDWAIEIRVISTTGAINFHVLPNLLCIYYADPAGFGGNVSLTAEAWLVVPGQPDVRIDDGQAVFGVGVTFVSSWSFFTSGATLVEGVHDVSLPEAPLVDTDYSFSFEDATVELGGSGTDYFYDTVTSADFTSGVTLSGGTITVPAGVQFFSVTVRCNEVFFFTSLYNRVTVNGVSGIGQIGGF